MTLTISDIKDLIWQREWTATIDTAMPEDMHAELYHRSGYFYMRSTCRCRVKTESRALCKGTDYAAMAKVVRADAEKHAARCPLRKHLQHNHI